MSALVTKILELSPGGRRPDRYRAYLEKLPEEALKQKMAGLLEDQTRPRRPGREWRSGRLHGSHS